MPVVRRPDWNDVTFGGSYRASFALIGGHVLLVRTSGRVRLADLEPALELDARIKEICFPGGRPYVRIEDWSGLKGTDREARDLYIRTIKNDERLRGLIFYGLPTFFRLAVKAAGRANLFHFVLKVVDGYAPAVHLAQKILFDKEGLSQAGVRPGNFPLLEPTNATEATDAGRVSTGGEGPQPTGQDDETARYVRELLHFMDRLDWSQEEGQRSREYDRSHPFAPVFEALSLLKWEFDDLLREQKQIQEELRRSKETAEKASRAKSDFLANMSHELRTPLNHIIGFTELVVDRSFGEINPEQEEYLNDVLQSSRHLLTLINDILDLSKIEAGKMELSCSGVPLAQMLENSLNMVKEKALKQCLQLKVRLEEVPATFWVDERKLRQILYNLLSNAVKFTPAGGTVNLEARGLNGQGVEIAVCDSGQGLTATELERIFLPFEQGDDSAGRKVQGTGLGLSLTKQMVEMHGGHIRAESAGRGQGAKFSFTIPGKGPDGKAS
jgi:signal transduction histidine kinase